MKKLLFVMLATAMLFGCQKKDADTTPALQDVSFNATEIIPEISREDWECKDVEPTHAWVQIDDGTTTTDYYLELFTVGGSLYTQSMKLPVGNYDVVKFVLYQEVNGTEGFGTGDIITHGTPVSGTDYAGYVTNPLPIDFDVTAFEKEDIDIEVLCFIDVDYLAFGFDWFEIFIIELNQICFFGDICLNSEPFEPADFDGSAYGTGLGIDIPAIMQIVVKQGTEEIATLSNYDDVDGLLDDGLLCVPYYDNEVYTLELYLWLPGDGDVFSYQLYYTYTLDDGVLDVDMGADLILDFVVGTCGYEGEADQTFDFLWTPPITANWETFYIRNHDGSIVAPWDANIVLIENAAGDGFSAETPESGQKVGYGTNAFDGVQVNTIEEIDFIKLSGSPNAPIPYPNFWVTDGVNYAVLACGSADYRGQYLITNNEWPIYEYNTSVDLDWLFDAPGDGSVGPNWSNHHLYLDGAPATLGDLSDNIVIFSGPDYNLPGIGTGAPRGGFGINIMFGDTQSNYIGSYQIGSLSITVAGVTYYAAN